VHNRRLSRRELDAIVAQRLDEVEMEGTESLYPRELSGGMQKRVGLARALAIEPAIVLYDEPTSGLDPVIAATIDDLIGRTRARHGVTSIVVSHDVTSVFALADRIAMVHEGTIIALGTPDELRSSGVPEVQRFLERGTAGQAHSRSVDTP
jgi:phospholipid/cholesterol/gamma-HCH transport system ATP-binding protein